MKPRRTHQSTATLSLPGGNEDNYLWVERTFHSESEVPITLSVWQPSDEERVAIATGANIELAVWGDVHPPVSLQATRVPLGAPSLEEAYLEKLDPAERAFIQELEQQLEAYRTGTSGQRRPVARWFRAIADKLDPDHEDRFIQEFGA